MKKIIIRFIFVIFLISISIVLYNNEKAQENRVKGSASNGENRYMIAIKVHTLRQGKNPQIDLLFYDMEKPTPINTATIESAKGDYNYCYDNINNFFIMQNDNSTYTCRFDHDGNLIDVFHSEYKYNKQPFMYSCDDYKLVYKALDNGDEEVWFESKDGSSYQIDINYDYYKKDKYQSKLLDIYSFNLLFIILFISYEKGFLFQKNQNYSKDGNIPNEAYCSMLKHTLLLIFTFGIWFFIWVYRTTEHLNAARDKPPREPAKTLLLCIFVPFYYIYWTYRSAQRVDILSKEKGIQSDSVRLCLVLSVFLPIVPPVIIQYKINAIVSESKKLSEKLYEQTAS